jgi:hypothetical protein
MSYSSLCKNVISERLVENIATVTTSAECAAACALLGVGVSAAGLAEMGPVAAPVVGAVIGDICDNACKMNLESVNKKSAKQIRNKMCDQIDDNLCSVWPTSMNTNC